MRIEPMDALHDIASGLEGRGHFRYLFGVKLFGKRYEFVMFVTKLYVARN